MNTSLMETDLIIDNLFSLEDFPEGSYCYWIFPFPVDEEENLWCHWKLKVSSVKPNFFTPGFHHLILQHKLVLEADPDEMVGPIGVDFLNQLNLTMMQKEGIEYHFTHRILIPEYVFNHIHNLPNPELNDKQKIQCLLLTGNAQLDHIVREAKYTYEENKKMRAKIG